MPLSPKTTIPRELYNFNWMLLNIERYDGHAKL